jgi:glutamyl-tRNA reductase
VNVANIDDLRAVVERHKLVRRAEARKAEGIVEEEIRTFAGWLGSLEVTPTIAALRAHGDEIVAGVLAENAGRWEALSERDRARVEAVARSVAQRLLHEPTLKVKQAGAERHARMHLLRELFGLSESDVDRRSELERTGGRNHWSDDGPNAEVRQLRPR